MSSEEVLVDERERVENALVGSVAVNGARAVGTSSARLDSAEWHLQRVVEIADTALGLPVPEPEAGDEELVSITAAGLEDLGWLRGCATAALEILTARPTKLSGLSGGR